MQKNQKQPQGPRISFHRETLRQLQVSEYEQVKAGHVTCPTFSQYRICPICCL
jgi:hypothetical protein